MIAAAIRSAARVALLRRHARAFLERHSPIAAAALDLDEGAVRSLRETVDRWERDRVADLDAKAAR